MVAAFGDLQIGVVPGRELDALGRHEVGEGIVRLGQVRVHRRHHFVGRVRPGDREHPGVGLLDDVALGAEAAGDDDLAVLGERFADGIERLLHRRIDETAGVDHDQVRVCVGRRDDVALGAKLRQDALGIDQRLGAAERDETDLGRNCRHGGR